MLAATFGNSWRIPGYEVRLPPAYPHPLFSWGPQGECTDSGPMGSLEIAVCWMTTWASLI